MRGDRGPQSPSSTCARHACALMQGLYLGTELPPQHPLVAAGTPLHGPNLFPERPAELRQVRSMGPLGLRA